MKRNHLTNLRTVALVAGIALAGLPFTSSLLGQSQNPQAQQDQPTQQDPQKPQSFVGKIVKLKSGQYALLMDEQAGKGVYLDDQEKAKEFEGQNVKVTGVLEVAKGLVHVTRIEPA